ncbi:hypothetical protein MUK42_04498 [Musa troglodytarum]|uniref:Uncharacterized protein n=1 Tax=Musa troglodytarum TaxID=320322 RepID=A0A9E7I7G3_9LILI|nr:hypothetical protein MUK42_04498 [Musa troglodytarum]
MGNGVGVAQHFHSIVSSEDLGADTNGGEWTREEEVTMSARAPIGVQAMKASSRDDKTSSLVKKQSPRTSIRGGCYAGVVGSAASMLK